LPHRSSRRDSGGSSDSRAAGDDRLEADTPEPELASGEWLLARLRGVGAVMFVTSDRLILARDGSQRRPRSGIQSVPLEAISHIRLETGSPPSGRIAVWVGSREAISIFFDAQSRERAQKAIDVARPAIARRRRESHGLPRDQSAE
jgi:hypothetical protein